MCTRISEISHGTNSTFLTLVLRLRAAVGKCEWNSFVYCSLPFREIRVRFNRYLRHMTAIQQFGTSASATGSRISRAMIIKLAGAVLVALFVVAPSLLFHFVGIGLSPILTGSMEPQVSPGDVLVTKTIPVNEIQVGDVIALVSQETNVLYAHRVVEIREQSGLFRIVTKGDANQEADLAPYLASPNDVVAKSVATVPWIGHPLVYLTSVQGRQASLSLIVTANIIAVFLWLFKEQIQQISEKAYQLYRDLYAEAQASKIEGDKAVRVFRDLFADSQESAAQEHKESRVYRDLFDESRVALSEQERKSKIYKDLFMQSHEEKDIDEAEMAQMITQMKLQQQEKENQ